MIKSMKMKKELRTCSNVIYIVLHAENYCGNWNKSCLPSSNLWWWEMKQEEPHSSTSEHRTKARPRHLAYRCCHVGTRRRLRTRVEAERWSCIVVLPHLFLRPNCHTGCWPWCEFPLLATRHKPGVPPVFICACVPPLTWRRRRDQLQAQPSSMFMKSG